MDMLGRTDQIYAGGLTTDASYMYWGGLPGGGLGLLIFQFGFQYAQAIRRIYEIGPQITAAAGNIGQPVYYIAARPEGQVSLGRVVGPGSVLTGFYRTYGNPCNPFASLFFASSAGCSTGVGGPPQGGLRFENLVGENARAAAANVANAVGIGAQQPVIQAAQGMLGWLMGGVLLRNLAINVNSQELLTQEQSQAEFVGLKVYYSRGLVDADGARPGEAFVWQEI